MLGALSRWWKNPPSTLTPTPRRLPVVEVVGTTPTVAQMDEVEAYLVQLKREVRAGALARLAVALGIVLVTVLLLGLALNALGEWL